MWIRKYNEMIIPCSLFNYNAEKGNDFYVDVYFTFTLILLAPSFKLKIFCGISNNMLPHQVIGISN